METEGKILMAANRKRRQGSRFLGAVGPVQRGFVGRVIT